MRYQLREHTLIKFNPWGLDFKTAKYYNPNMLERSPENITAQCAFSNGECPQTCQLYDRSLALTRRFGTEFMKTESRRRLLFADSFDSSIELIQIARALVSCEKEPQRPRRR